MKVLGIILTIILILVSAGLITLVMLQTSKSEGIAGMGSGSETFYGKNKNASREQKLDFYTKISSIVFVVLCVALVLIQQFAA